MPGFRITFHMQSPVVFNEFTTLDGSLCGILFGGADADSIDLGMLDAHKGVPMGSLPVLDNWKPLAYAMRPNVDRHIAASRIVESRLDRKSSTMRRGGDYSNGECYDPGSYGRYFEASTISYFATGDRNEIRRIVSEAGAIGGQTSKGYGTIVRGQTEVRPLNTRLCGILDDEGRLSRPIPVSLAQELDIPKSAWVGKMGRWKAPYRPQEVMSRGETLEHIAYPKRWVL